MTTYVALLRGVNVGGHRRVPMGQLRDVLRSLGHTGVTTYLQSGNAVFRSDQTDPDVLALTVRTAVRDALARRGAPPARRAGDRAPTTPATPAAGTGTPSPGRAAGPA